MNGLCMLAGPEINYEYVMLSPSGAGISTHKKRLFRELSKARRGFNLLHFNYCVLGVDAGSVLYGGNILKFYENSYAVLVRILVDSGCHDFP